MLLGGRNATYLKIVVIHVANCISVSEIIYRNCGLQNEACIREIVRIIGSSNNEMNIRVIITCDRCMVPR